MGDPVSRRLNSESEVQVMESLQEQIIRATQQLQNTIMDSGMSSGINSITNNTETRLPSQSNPVQVPNSSREGAFGGVNSGVNVNASPSKRNYNNLLSCIDLGNFIIFLIIFFTYLILLNLIIFNRWM